MTMSYQSKREVASESRDTRATVDIDAEAEVRVSWTLFFKSSFKFVGRNSSLHCIPIYRM